ncbi:hypothetical protein [Burkholderia multivorans]|uniref:hypothetical protein n=1 Tax=Burkholderia multivorans TaxID=87883 RepID=UPI000CFF0F55|nr:hypothetical protein [Burkholderia multivorans]MBR8239514.1 hypothetical protein [Burkholderia multivorans]PRG36687.1 hypothetical protein C6T52_14205 [Burkholderia multivorans]
MNQRDDFSEKVKRAVAARAGWHCSFAGCAKLTVGPSEEAPHASANLGEAAHICAASPGGRRYDPNMTPDERAGINNAIWLCSNHAKLIDRDAVTYTAGQLREMKRSHEAACARAVRTGSNADPITGLVSIGPDIVCTASITRIDAHSWTLRFNHFLIGDLHEVISFISSFASEPLDHRYILSNELGDGRMLTSAPSLLKQADGYSLLCPVAPSFPRVNVYNIGSGLASHDDTNDLYLNAKGNIARVSGIDYFPQRVREILSLQRGESPFQPTFGMRFFEYFEAYSGSPWLDLLFKLDVVRQASVPYEDSLQGRQYTPLQCVTRVHNVELLAPTREDKRLPVRVDFEVQGLGRWERELSIYMPTAEEMAERARMLQSRDWLSVTAIVGRKQ